MRVKIKDVKKIIYQEPPSGGGGGGKPPEEPVEVATNVENLCDKKPNGGACKPGTQQEDDKKDKNQQPNDKPTVDGQPQKEDKGQKPEDGGDQPGQPGQPGKGQKGDDTNGKPQNGGGSSDDNDQGDKQGDDQNNKGQGKDKGDQEGEDEGGEEGQSGQGGGEEGEDEGEDEDGEEGGQSGGGEGEDEGEDKGEDEGEDKGEDKGEGEGEDEGGEEGGYPGGPSGGEGDEEGDEEGEGESEAEKARRYFENLKKELGQMDNHIEEPDQEPLNIIEVPEGEESGDNFTPNDPNSTHEDDTNRIVDEAKGIQQRSEEKSGGRTGSGGSSHSSLGADTVDLSTNWEVVLRDFFEENVKSVYSYMNPDKRLTQHGIVMRTKREEVDERLDLVIAVDTSGSISRPIFNTFISEIISIIDSFDKLKFKLLLFHSNVYAEVEVELSDEPKYDFEEPREDVKGVSYRKITDKEEAKTEFKHLMLYQTGGTVVSSVTSYLEQLGITEVDGLLVLTDGDTETNINLPDAKNVLFMINEGGITTKVAPYGTVVMVDIPHALKNKY
jgi:predicted metal-dependent peptidase